MSTHVNHSEVTAASGNFPSETAPRWSTSTESPRPRDCVFPPVIATGAFALFLLAGTGGTVAGQTRSGVGQLSNPTSVNYRLLGRPNWPERTQVEELSPTVLTRIRAHFGLNMSEFASVARVSRPTVYAWLRGETQLQQGHADRIACLARLVRFAVRLSPKPVNRCLHRNLSSGATLYSMLVRDQIDEAQVRAALTEIGDVMSSEANSGPSRATAVELARRFGYVRPPTSFADEVFGEEAD